MQIIERIKPETPYGYPSDEIILSKIGSQVIAFLPRHGSKHTIPPHRVPYKANLAALKAVGAEHVIGTCVAGSLRQEIEPGTFLIPDQFINLTWGRDDTFSVDQRVLHLPMAEPYCQCTTQNITAVLKSVGVKSRFNGTVVVIQGPRFSTMAESRMFALWGGDIVNMTQYPECYFARELGICYSVIASITDYDSSVQSEVAMRQDSMERVLEVFRMNTEKTIEILFKIAEIGNQITTCDCAKTEFKEYYSDGQIGNQTPLV